jgi:hypothetical protein
MSFHRPVNYNDLYGPKPNPSSSSLVQYTYGNGGVGGGGGGGNSSGSGIHLNEHLQHRSISSRTQAHPYRSFSLTHTPPSQEAQPFRSFSLKPPSQDKPKGLLRRPENDYSQIAQRHAAAVPLYGVSTGGSRGVLANPFSASPSSPSSSPSPSSSQLLEDIVTHPLSSRVLLSEGEEEDVSSSTRHDDDNDDDDAKLKPHIDAYYNKINQDRADNSKIRPWDNTSVEMQSESVVYKNNPKINLGLNKSALEIPKDFAAVNEPMLNTMTIAELKNFCKNNNILVKPTMRKKADLVHVCMVALSDKLKGIHDEKETKSLLVHEVQKGINNQVKHDNVFVQKNILFAAVHGTNEIYQVLNNNNNAATEEKHSISSHNKELVQQVVDTFVKQIKQFKSFVRRQVIVHDEKSIMQKFYVALKASIENQEQFDQYSQVLLKMGQIIEPKLSELLYSNLS